MAEEMSRSNIQKQADAVASAVEEGAVNGVMMYGTKAQHALADFSASLLDQLRSVKTGDIEEPLSALLVQVQSVSLHGLDADDKNAKRFMRRAKKVLAGFSQADKRIFELEMRLDAIKGDLMRDIVLLDKLKEKNSAHRKMLETYIAAGEKIIAEKTKAVKGGRASVIEAGSALSVLEKRIYDLKLTHTIAMQTDPQISLIQTTNQTLVSRIQTSLLNTIPLWRSQMTLAATLIKQKSVMNMEKQLAETASARLREGAEALKKAAAKGENPLAAVQKAGEELAETIRSVKTAYESGESDIEAALKTVDVLSKKQTHNRQAF